MTLACIAPIIDKINAFIANIIGNPNLVTSVWLILAIGVGFAIFESIWRRWFGGGFDYRWLRWLNYRWLKHTLNIIALFAVCYWVHGLQFMWSIYFAAILDGVFWAPSFGMFMDIGRQQPVIPPEEQEYQQQFCAKLLNWLFSKKYWYGQFYDFMGMVFRFGAPCLLLFFVPTFNSGMILLGFWVAMMYGLGWAASEKKAIKKLGATEFAEFASGAFVGWMTAVCGMI